MPTIKFIKEKQTVECQPGANLREVARKNGVEIYAGIHKYPLMNCMGLSMCGKCAVLVKKGMENCSPMGIRETLRLKPSMIYIGNETEMRLACQTEVNGNIEVETQPGGFFGVNMYGDRFWG